MTRSPVRVAILTEGGPAWPAGQPSGAPCGDTTLLARALALACEFDPEPLVCAVSPPSAPGLWTWVACRETGDAWGALAPALAAARAPVIALALELPLTPRVWLDYLRRLAVVHWPAGQAPAGAPLGVVPVRGDGWEPRAGLFHPALGPKLAAGWRPAASGADAAAGPVAPGSAAAAAGEAAAGEEPFLVLPPESWREIAGPAGLDACRDPEELRAVLARAEEAGEEAGRRQRCRDPRRGEADGGGRFTLVDVGDKPVTRRQATAAGVLCLGPRAYPRLAARDLPKGDALQAAQLAAIQAVKRTWAAIPLCHPVPVDSVGIAWRLDDDARRLEVFVTVRAAARTGVEMEALHGVAVFLLTVYDMTKGLDRGQTITDVRLLAKSGGSRGDYRRSGGTAPLDVGGKEPA